MRKISLLALVALIVTIGARSSFTSNTPSPAPPFCTADPVVTESFLVTVTPVNDAPHDVLLSNTNVSDNSPASTLVGTLTAIDPDPLQTFTYSLVSGSNSIDNASFTISGDQLRTTSVFDFETKTSYLIRLRATDPTNLQVEKELIINVVDGPDSPGAISFTSPTFSVGEADGNASITLKRTGGTDNRVFAKVSLAGCHDLAGGLSVCARISRSHLQHRHRRDFRIECALASGPRSSGAA